MRKHVLTFERSGAAISYPGQADIWLCVCGERFETCLGGLRPEPITRCSGKLEEKDAPRDK